MTAELVRWTGGGTNNAAGATDMVRRGSFPHGFIFGSASSAFQIEGAAKEGGREPSIWDTFILLDPKRVKERANANVAIDHYHKFKEDVKMMKKIGLDAYRFSISWSRVLPGGNLCGGINKEGINFYNELIDELLKNDIEPYVTLFHWDLPQALESEYKGFLSNRIVNDFCEFAELCFWEFGDRVKHWMTLNEPWTFSDFGYCQGKFPPGRGATTEEHANHLHIGAFCVHRCIRPPQVCSEGDPGREPYIVTHNLLLAHSAVVDLYRQKFQKTQQGQIGIALVSQWFEPLDPNQHHDVSAADRALDFMLGWYLQPLATGEYPETMRKLVGHRLPKFKPEESHKLKGSYDFIGINYYTATYVTVGPTPAPNKLSYETDARVTYKTERNGVDIGSMVAGEWLHCYPEGIYKLLNHIRNACNSPPIYITENGFIDKNDNSLTVAQARVDEKRITYLHDHLVKVQEAINVGVDVKGYFIWSIMDNFEWADGYTQRFGIIYIDYKDDLTRYPKESAFWLMNILNDEEHSKSLVPAGKRSAGGENEEHKLPKRLKK